MVSNPLRMDIVVVHGKFFRDTGRLEGSDLLIGLTAVIFRALSTLNNEDESQGAP